jgi:cyanophycinase
MAMVGAHLATARRRLDSEGFVSGWLALIGGAEWRDGCSFDRTLLEATGGEEVLILPTAAAYEHPERAVEWAVQYFDRLGAKARGLMVLSRGDAEDRDNAAAVRQSRFIYLAGGSPMHLRSVLKDSKLWDALVAAWHDGATLAGSSAGAMVLCDPMVDPRGGAFTLGLALVAQVAIIPHHDTWSPDKARRTIKLAPAGLPVVAIDEQTALLRTPDGDWRVEGKGQVVVFRDGHEASLDALPQVHHQV